MSPDGRLLGPDAIRIQRLKRRRGFAKRGRVAGGLVLGYAGPIERLRRDVRIRVFVDSLTEQRPGTGEISFSEFLLGESEFHLRKKLIGREKTLEAVPLSALRVRDDNRRRPLRTEALEPLGILLNVILNGNEVLVNKIADPWIRVYLGLQPGAPGSHRSGAEIEEQGLFLAGCLLKRRIDGVIPFNGHRCPSCR